MTKYILKGLDCAHCANRIEQALTHKGFTGAQVNFATQSVELDPTRLVEAQQIVETIEPGVRLVSAGTPDPVTEDDREARRQGVRIAVTLGLFALGFGFSAWGSKTPWAWAEPVSFLMAYGVVGFPVLWAAAKNIARGQVFDEMFLMSIATVGALVLGQFSEAVGVMLFYSVGEFFQDRAVARSRKSIGALMNLRPEFARVLVDGRRESRRPEAVVVGDWVEVLPGERVPLDGEVVEGESFVDTASLTGESVPRSVSSGSEVLSGFINEQGRLVVRVTRPFAQSSAARILELVESASARKAPTERFITKFAGYYTPAVVGLAALVALVPPLVVPGALFSDWLYRGLVILVISCPCALVLSIPLGYFGGLGGASRNKLLIKGGNYLDALRRVDTVVFDKTGTLTQGVFAVTDVVPQNGFTRDELLRWASAAEGSSSHPIACSLRDAQGGTAPQATDVSEIRGHGVIAVVEGRRVHAGSRRLLDRDGIAHGEVDAPGTLVLVAVDGLYAGYIVVSDRVKDDAAATVAELKRQGVRRVVMLTGDDASVAARVAGPLGVDEVHAQQLPEDKVAHIERLILTATRGQVIFVGDGINDAPVLIRADIGFAMGGLGSDAAIEAADVVVMDDSLPRIPQALRIAQFTRRVVVQNIGFALGVKGVFVVLGIFGSANLWEAVVADVGVALLAILNAMRTIRWAGR